VPPAICVILAAGQLSDATVTYVAVPAIALASGYRVLAGWFGRHSRPAEAGARSPGLRGLWSADAAVLLAAIASVPLEMAVRALMTGLGAYQMVAPKTQLASPGHWLHHFPVVWINVRYLYGAVARPDTMLGAAGAALGLICLIAAIAGLGKVAWTWHRASRGEQVIAAVIVVNIGVYLLSSMPLPSSARELAAVLPCGAVLAARALVPGQLTRKALAVAAVAVSGVIALLPLAVAAARPPVGPATGPGAGDSGRAPTAPLTAWLEAHGVRYGIAGYWDSSVITLQSGGRVAIRAVNPVPVAGGGWRVDQPYWEVNAQWYDPARHDARWAIADPRGLWSVSNLEMAFGQPEAIYPVGDWFVLEFRVNLLTEIGPEQVIPGGGPGF
jgi:hypothetical protein